jgi:N-formylglutamate amidohydrolase
MLTAAISWDDFWQTAWPIVAAPLFLIVGYLGTFLTNSKIEARRYEQEKERRTHEWQRTNLVELQELLTVHYQNGLRAVVDFNRLDRDGELDELRQHETPTPESIRDSDQTNEYTILCTRIRVLIERCIDREVAHLCDPYMATLAAALMESDLDRIYECSTRAKAEFNAAAILIGELLRTTYA